MSEETHMEFFWEVAEPFLAEENVTRSTMMGFPCMRINGDYFASSDHKTGDLIIKLAADRVEELINAGVGHAFAPNGRRFREWVMLTDRDAKRWADLIGEAKVFVVENPPKKRKKKKK